MAQYELIMPKMGESVAEATIIKWLKNEGDRIELEEAVLEIATDKVDSEVPSPVEGILVKKLFNENDVVKVGQAIALIDTAANGSSATATTASPSTVPSEAAAQAEALVAKAVETVQPAAEIKSTAGRFYSPLVRSIAAQEGISQAELDSIPGTGSEGRVTKNDILNYLKNRKSAPAAAPAPASSSIPAASAPATSQAAAQPQPVAIPYIKAPTIEPMPGDEIIEMDRMRRLIADHMVMSKHVSPHVTSFVEADVTNIVLWRERVKKDFEKRTGEKLTYTPIFIEAIVRAIKDFPMINISVDGYNIVKHRDINIGMATALPSGNLIVPVIKNADQYNLVGLTKMVNDLANRARNNQLKPDDIKGGTYTISNVGTFGNVLGTPVINQPQVAIMAVGAIRKKPAVLETPHGDVIAIRHMMFLSHSYDHRVVDGALGGSFVRRVADYLEQFDINRDF
ncbi:dihydrolipoamide acetyltransferase component of pyruvate dehydrogenase complex [Thermaurantimonas aggregans]|uniref:Dihydrolipoamide acetyltransferase component of pyruvate dehydrogenase complex n=1 Tax=Thermaurantimonas aggregans TaxID=2173829 RepID=A0A401XMT5_9FLAO|nr:dihydrolipoamide acetyltransferase family protein [Thermaurantimonas aggregans]MCX8148109.1 2-oxo acid dehydrogenase subunit E2 [Thermaurantimonas aggregans]GCD78335.1 dihydrolipoamide acetyltransferase component of pyruvate dehydrogenase complex [Thermaurantimonas aggregans]